MRHNSFLIRLLFLWLCLSPVLTLGQLKPAVEAKRQTKKVDDFVREKMSANHIPGLSLAVVRNGKIVLSKGYGMANLELNVPATEKTNYLIYSITKTFTAVATMMLVEEGKISLEDPISKYLSGLPPVWNPVSVRQLLNHTSGINSFTNHDKTAIFLKTSSVKPGVARGGFARVISAVRRFVVVLKVACSCGKIVEPLA